MSLWQVWRRAWECPPFFFLGSDVTSAADTVAVTECGGSDGPALPARAAERAGHLCGRRPRLSRAASPL